MHRKGDLSVRSNNTQTSIGTAIYTVPLHYVMAYILHLFLEEQVRVCSIK